MSGIRPFAPGDIRAVVDLRGRTFALSEHPTAMARAAYFERLFFRNPWSAGASPSLVYEDSSGRVAGFLGVVDRPATFRGEPLRIATCTQFMIDATARGLAPVQLVRTFLDGPQDLSFVDAANDASRRIWEALGGSVAPMQSLTWIQPLRPARFRVGQAAGSVAGRAAARAVRPALAVLDALTTRWPAPRSLSTTALTPDLMAAHLATVVGVATLQPAYEAVALRWLMDQLELKRDWGALRSAALRATDGSLAGWYLYFANRNGTGEVVQVAASPSRLRETLAALFHDAWREGLVALSGRGERGVIPSLDPAMVQIARGDPWALVHSHRADIRDVLERGEIFLSRLEGEWWMSF